MLSDKTNRKITDQSRKYTTRALNREASENIMDCYQEGAIPWAYWCERFERAIANDNSAEIYDVWQEYRDFLEADGE